MSKKGAEGEDPHFVKHMPSFCKALIKVMDFAKAHDESTLQNYGHYRGFKRKKLKSEHLEGIKLLIQDLNEHEYYEEHIFWCKRFLEMTTSKEGD